MLTKIITLSLRNKFIVLLGVVGIIALGLFSLSRISIGAVPDVTNNQVQVITTSTSLSTLDMEQFITYPVELEMANLPGVKEIRSISKFGLSVVTIVFEDDMGTYLPRQLIAEKIESVKATIPEGFGTPQMGPISTGLGEIYQYVLDVEPAFKDRYTVTDLRTIQDWQVKRQLSGIPGVVEVNTWGGYLKQYEVAISSTRLAALKLSVREVYEALESNNSVGGGSYIEKQDQAYFIRGEGLVTSLDDIRQIVVANRDGIPIYIRDLAEVDFGHAPRYGAITGNGEGEKVLGQIMMLKDANSLEVIQAVKKRVSEISETLPEGVYINGFLDRSELIAKTSRTVAENLILGCLIVVLIVVLLLGNARSGLVVASVIPLSLLFAISLMYLFGVDANLMSLGAIDFGIIIDGAVIIVEFVAYKFARTDWASDGDTSIQLNTKRDEITGDAASRMMNSAIFGQLIILLVFIPVLTLSGVEGKMFRPMALTFCFALIGAILLCLTYVPVASSMWLKPGMKKLRLSDRLVSGLLSVYRPVIDWALAQRRTVLALAVVLIAATAMIFTRMGSEFVPTLDEGDFVIQPVLRTGTSLSETIKITTRIERILLDSFPEVDQVITRIGAAEVPTDPMSMEESDVIIRLKPRSEWVTSKSKDELADRFKAALGVIPNMEVEFTQPIEMRFNELITGVRADIAVKIFGEDLEVLNAKANQIGNLARSIEGAADVAVEKVVGLPQMQINYDRQKIARYGLQIDRINELVALAYAGQTAGSVFEGERRFDLVVRLNESERTDIDRMGNLYVDLPSGGKIPLREVAEISYGLGAAKISRDDTRRRIVVGINVRNRDLQSVVDDLKSQIGEDINLPPGYYLQFGGQFENLESARNRLMWAVPLALALIFSMLYLAFNSFKEALLIFTAIPLAAVGGVLMLWVRDMPFSISAGIGFIALFGIAVLNGIVLIEHLKKLKQQTTMNTMERIRQGTADRMRAVLLTASAAALGFLPMAVSTNVGAEVQRPLATVVIGGLITATILTLVVLPVLYSWLEEKSNKVSPPVVKKTLLFLIVIGFVEAGQAQQTVNNLNELKLLALSSNSGIKAADLQLDRAEAEIGGAFNFEKTEVYYGFDKNNIALNGQPIEVVGVKQKVAFPTVYFADRDMRRVRRGIAMRELDLEQQRLLKVLSSAYVDLQIERARIGILRLMDSIYKEFSRMAERRFELGETNYLEKVTSQAKRQQIRLELQDALRSEQANLVLIQALVQSPDSLTIITEVPERLLPSLVADTLSPQIQLYKEQQTYANERWQLEKQRLLPDVSFEYFWGSNSGLNGTLNGYQVGLSIPLLFSGQSSRIKTSRLAMDVVNETAKDVLSRYQAKRQGLELELEQQSRALSYFEADGKSLSEAIVKSSEVGYRNGEIDFFQYIQSLENAYTIGMGRLEALRKYNQTVIELNYLLL